jgi:hypothetical protein
MQVAYEPCSTKASLSRELLRELEAELRKRVRLSAVLVAVYCLAEIGISLPFAFHRLWAAPLEAFTHRPHQGFVYHRFIVPATASVRFAKLKQEIQEVKRPRRERLTKTGR